MTLLPFVVAPPGDRSLTDGAARAASERWGLPAPQYLRTGMNALYACGEHVLLRVGRTTAPPAQGVWLLEFLTEHGLRVPAVVRPEPFVAASGLSVVAHARVRHAGPVDWRAVGQMVRALHRISPAAVEPHYPVPAAVTFPHWEVGRVRAEVDDLLAPADADALDAAIARVGEWQGACAAAPQVLCHGDVHPGNVVQSSDGPVLLDWDLLCTGPAAWDHAAVLTWGERWDGEADLYDRFADGYGQTARGGALGDMLAELRLLVATLMRVRAGRHDADARTEAERRLRYWRGEADAPRWHPA